MRNFLAGNRSFAGKTKLRVICIAVVASLLVLAVECLPPALAQSAAADWEKTAGVKMSFDVAAVKQDLLDASSVGARTNVPLSAMDKFSLTGGLFSASNFPLFVYIGFAYKQNHQQERFITSELPKWAIAKRYDVEARASGNPTKDQYRLMMQDLLAKRFKLSAHYETKQVPVLALVQDKLGRVGPQLREHKPGESISCAAMGPAGDTPWFGVAGELPKMCGVMEGMPATSPGRVRDGSLASSPAVMADMFSYLYDTDKIIIDQTGLGTVDWVIEFTPDATGNPNAPVDSNGPTFLEALKDQLGLKFESKVMPVEFLRIDHIEEPSPN